jgi:hypothetical protein
MLYDLTLDGDEVIVIVVDRGVTMVRVKWEEDELVGDWWEARRWGSWRLASRASLPVVIGDR